MNNQGLRQRLPLAIWPIILVVAGVLLLLYNFLLINFNVAHLWPILLVALGLQVLINGDLGISWVGRSFGITRGSVEAGVLRANAGELDIQLRALQHPGRLISGQYTDRSRPQLVADGNRAILTMDRSKTWWLSLADWEIEVADDLPWNFLLSTSLGKIDVDLRGIIVEQTAIATGIGNITCVAPDNPAGPINIRSVFGDIDLTIPPDLEAAVTIKSGPFFGVQVSSDRWQQTDGRYITANYHTAVEPLELTISGTFGDLYLT